MTDATQTQEQKLEEPSIESGLIPFTQWGSVSAEMLSDMEAAKAVAAALDKKATDEQAKAKEAAGEPATAETWAERLQKVEEARKAREEFAQSQSQKAA